MTIPRFSRGPAALALSVLLVFAALADAQANRPARRNGQGGGAAGAGGAALPGRTGRPGMPDAATTTAPSDGIAELPALQKLQERISSLDLSDDQKKQMQALKDQIAETIRGMAPELKDLTPDERRVKIRESLGNVREQFTAILTPEQKTKLRDAAEARTIPGRKPLNDLKADPTTKPDKGEGKGLGKGLGKGKAGEETPLVARVRAALDGVGLSPEQKTQTDAILDDAAVQAKQLRQTAAGDRDAARTKAMELAQSLRTKLAAVLTPEQRTKLAESIPGGRGGGLGGGLGGRRNATPATRPATDKPAAKADATRTPDSAVAKATGASSRPSVAAVVAPVVVGSPAPAFTLTRLTGPGVTNKTFTGKPLVLAFGSLTSPAFRDRLARLDALKLKYRGRANVVIVYVREAHPSDGWQVERNRDDKLEIKKPATTAERVALARQLQERTKTTLDVLVDAIDDATLTAFGETLEGAAVISPYGTLVGTQTYCDPSGLPRMIDEALRAQK